MDIEAAVAAAFAGEKTKPTQEMYDGVASPRKNLHEVSLLDPLGTAFLLTTLEAEINTFLTEVDFVLSENNAKTEIEVD
jgi:hypothetical protein